MTARIRPALTLAIASLLAGCGASRVPLRAELPPSPIAAPVTLEENHFRRDRMGALSEAGLREILAAPVFLEAGARIGVVPVASRYEMDDALPLAEVPAALSGAMEGTGLFEVSSEMSTDWPSDRSISGLRELGARYRAEYLMLYRHRFVDRSYTNGWGWGYVTVLGALFLPSHTLESAGVLEASLFDVKTGTLLFTVFERVHDERDANVWHNERKRRALKAKLLRGAAAKLADQVVGKLHRLAAARPESTEKRAVADAS